jgi:ABC-type transporter MlaC component
LIGAPAGLPAEGGAPAPQAQDGDGADKRREAAARSVVDTALAEVIAVLANADLSSEQRLASIEKIVRERFDMPLLARLVLGKKNRSRFSDSQAARYLCEFEPYVSNYIGIRLDRYQQEKVKTVSAKWTKGHVFVLVRILGGRYDQALLGFRMRESRGRWLAFDVEFEGISVVKTLGAQFAELLSSGGPERLIQVLADRNGSRSDC